MITEQYHIIVILVFSNLWCPSTCKQHAHGTMEFYPVLPCKSSNKQLFQAKPPESHWPLKSNYQTLQVLGLQWTYGLFTVKLLCLWFLISVITDKYGALHTIKITVTVTPSDSNPVNFSTIVSLTFRLTKRDADFWKTELSSLQNKYSNSLSHFCNTKNKPELIHVRTTKHISPICGVSSRILNW